MLVHAPCAGCKGSYGLARRSLGFRSQSAWIGGWSAGPVSRGSKPRGRERTGLRDALRSALGPAPTEPPTATALGLWGRLRGLWSLYRVATSPQTVRMSDQSQGPGWWIGSDGKWYPPPDGALVPSQLVSTAQPAAQPHAGACSVCGVQGQLRARQEIIGFPIAIGVDRWMECGACRSRV